MDAQKSWMNDRPQKSSQNRNEPKPTVEISTFATAVSRIRLCVSLIHHPRCGSIAKYEKLENCIGITSFSICCSLFCARVRVT